MDYLEELNEAQKTAVMHTEGPLLILAGAGAGKTKTITYRIMHLIQKGTNPSNMLAVTFTNKAAKEMKGRVETLLAKTNKYIFGNEKPHISTFHGLGHFIIKQNYKELGIKKHFTILDRSDSKKIIKEGLEKMGIETKNVDPNKIINIISREKGNFVDPEEYKTGYDSYFENIVKNIWNFYEKKLKEENALDFDDLLVKTAKLLQIEEVREKYRKKWNYIHIDEYQDTNAVQYKLIKYLVGDEKNICAVGDIDQNIYSWRGANIKNILNFEKDFENTKTVILEENYRSTQTILAIANRAIEKNKLRFEKKLVTRNGVGEKVSVFEALTENHEAQFVAEKIKSLMQNNVSLNEIAILYRANFQSRVLEEELLKKNIEYQVLGTKFLERKEIKDVISFLRLAINPESISDLKRIINIPPRGIGKTTLLKIVEKKENELPIKTKMKISNFNSLMFRIKEFAFTNKLSETVRFIIKETGLGESLNKTEEDKERLENLKELVSLSQRYEHLEIEESIEKFLEETSLTTDQDSDKDDKTSVRLMTVHASKGLEFSYVFIVGLEEGLFPSDKNEDSNVSAEEAEEERRLFYVAITRARKKLFLSYSQTRTIFGNRNINTASEFLIEIPEEYVDREFMDYAPKRKSLLDIEF